MTALLISLIGIGLGSGCDEFLDVPPEDDLSRAEQFATERGAEAAVIGLYHGLSEYHDNNLSVYADLPANIAPATEGSTPDGELVAQRRALERLHARTLDPELEDTEIKTIYQFAYEVIFQASDVIDAIPEFTQGNPGRLTSLVAEARAIRAVVHFDLVRLFAQAPAFSEGGDHPGVPIITEPPGVFDLPARATVAETYAFVRTELQAALADLDIVYSRRSSAPVWLTPAVIHGLLARVAAYERDWAGCLDRATRCIEATSATLTPAGSYVDEWRNGELRELLWQLDLQRLVLRGGGIFFTPGRVIGVNNPEPLMRVSEDLAGAYPDGDLRLRLFRRDADDRLLSEKWPFDTNFIVNPPMLRLSDVYLLRAEAYAELGNLAEARQDLDRIYRRALPGGPDVPTTQTGLVAAIREERRRELALEGHHFFDLGRWGVGLGRNDCVDPVVDCNIAYPDHRFVLPIPGEAIRKNP